MADTTSTASTYLAPIQWKSSPGEIAIGGKVATASVSHCIKVGKLPAGAVITDWWLHAPGLAATSGIVYRLARYSGTSSMTTLPLETISSSGIIRMLSSGALDYYMETVSVSDACPKKYWDVEIFTSTAAHSGTLHWRFKYVTNRPV